jgi:signal transduction histidine kinase
MQLTPREIATFDVMPCGVSVGAPVRALDGTIVDFNVLYANPSTRELFPQLQFPGENLWSERFPEAHTGEMFNSFKSVIETGLPHLVDFNDRGPFTERSAAVFQDVAVVRHELGYFATYRNVATEQRQRKEIEHSRQLLADVLALSNQPVGRCDAAGGLIWCNNTYLQLAGLDSLEAVVGRPVWELFQTIALADGSDHTDLRLFGLARHLETHDQHHLIGEFGNTFGETRHMEWISRPLRDEDGAVVEYQFVGSDLTQWRESTSALRDINRLLARSREQERQKFAARLHDDALQHLVAAAWSLDGIDEADTASMLIKQAVDGVHQCLKEMAPSSALLDPIEYLIEGKLTALRVRRVGIDLQIQQPQTEAALVLTTRILLEALDNVIEHSNASNVTISVTTTSELVEIEVSDDGAGYSVLSAERAAASGSLSLVSLQALVEANNGTLELQRSHPRGTTLKAALPAYMDVFK